MLFFTVAISFYTSKNFTKGPLVKRNEIFPANKSNDRACFCLSSITDSSKRSRAKNEVHYGKNNFFNPNIYFLIFCMISTAYTVLYLNYCLIFGRHEKIVSMDPARCNGRGEGC